MFWSIIIVRVFRRAPFQLSFTPLLDSPVMKKRRYHASIISYPQYIHTTFWWKYKITHVFITKHYIPGCMHTKDIEKLRYKNILYSPTLSKRGSITSAFASSNAHNIIYCLVFESRHCSSRIT
jgi:hypothetical protein